MEPELVLKKKVSSILYSSLEDPSRIELQLSIEIRVEKKLRQVK